MERFSIPCVAGIIEKKVNGTTMILLQERWKENAVKEEGLVEIPAGKIRENENIFDALRREIWEETGLEVNEIQGEEEAGAYASKGYKVLDYMPFACSQNIQGNYPILVLTFICTAKGELLEKTNETQNIRWTPVSEVEAMLESDSDAFYPMHVASLRKYIHFLKK